MKWKEVRFWCFVFCFGGYAINVLQDTKIIDSYKKAIATYVEVGETAIYSPKEIGARNGKYNASTGDRGDEMNSYPPCFTNTKKWLAGPRNSNSDESDMTKNLIRSIIMDGKPVDTDNGSFNVLDQTMCFAESRFETWDSIEELKNTDEAQDTTNTYLKYLVQRLMYLVIHENQHRPAKAEAMARYHATGSDSDGYCMKEEDGEMIKVKVDLPSDIGKFDFECDPDTKYIVAGLGHNNGMGMVVRTNAPEAIFFGVVSNRVVLWDNEAKSNFFSCSRYDWQCLFLPMSPCVLTKEDVSNAPTLSSSDVNEFRNNGKLPESYENEKVIKLSTGNYRTELKDLRQTFVNRIESLYERKSGTNSSALQHPWEIDRDILRRVGKYILDSSSEYHVWKMWGAPLMYMLRPNMLLRNEIDRILRKSIPDDFDSNKAIGIPIRAGDKCVREQKCFGFEKYMELAKAMAKKRANITFNSYDTLVLTSDSKDMIEERFKYIKNDTFPFRFVVNEEDVLQGHGSPKLYNTDSYSANDVMISSMAAMKMQFLPETIVPNSCSSFHKVMGGFFDSGCGMARNPYAETLKENDDPSLRMKCAWGRRLRGQMNASDYESYDILLDGWPVLDIVI